jgi:ATP-dependent Clp protease ATP-binding subunit ClpA
MMFERFTKDAREAVSGATVIARDLGAVSVEAEHVLLAVTNGSSPAARVLHAAGLDFDGLNAALVAETTRSLAAVGVTADALHFSPFVKTPKLGASAKLMLERSLRIALARRDKHIGGEHLVLAALRATTGTVPRALECAGVDRVELTAKVERVAGGAPPSP